LDKEIKKILVTAYSFSGNTRDAAKIIAKKLGGDFRAILPKNKYPKSYTETLARSKVEIGIKKEPELQEQVDISDYDVIFVGTPNWFSTLAPPVRTFLADNDFKGKTVIPFATHGGGGRANCTKDMAELAEGAKIIEGFALHGNEISEQAVSAQINKINI